MFHKTGPIVFFAMEHLGVVDEEELDHVCSERETALDRPLHQWEREIIHHHLRNESLKAVSREERLHIPGFDKVIWSVCLSVCLSRKMITSSWESPVTTWTPHNHPVQLQVSFDGSRLVFHGSMSVFIGFQGFRLVSRWFHGFSRFLVGFHGFSSRFHGFSWFLVGFHGFSSWFHGFSWFLVGSHGFSRKSK